MDTADPPLAIPVIRVRTEATGSGYWAAGSTILTIKLYLSSLFQLVQTNLDIFIVAGIAGKEGRPGGV